MHPAVGITFIPLTVTVRARFEKQRGKDRRRDELVAVVAIAYSVSLSLVSSPRSAIVLSPPLSFASTSHRTSVAYCVPFAPFFSPNSPSLSSVGFRQGFAYLSVMCISVGVLVPLLPIGEVWH
jgi:hypothetical protein